MAGVAVRSAWESPGPGSCEGVPDCSAPPIREECLSDGTCRGESGSPDTLGRRRAQSARSRNLLSGRALALVVPAHPGLLRPGPEPASRSDHGHGGPSGRGVARQHLPKLLESPVRRRMGRDIVMHDSACPHFLEDQYVKDAEPGGDHHKEIARHNRLGVVADESHPTLLWVGRAPWPGPVGWILADRKGLDSNPQLEQEFGSDSGLAPSLVGRGHFPDEFPQMDREMGPSTRLGFPAPE